MALFRKRSAGFTLLEILIVVVILGALAALAIPAYTATTEKAKKSEALQTLMAVRMSQQRYYSGNGSNYANTFAVLDFDPTQTLAGNVPIFSYTIATSAANAYTAKASRFSNAGTGGAYTITINQAGTTASNF